MPATYENLATTTLSSATASITFSSISAAYTDLRVVLVGSTTSSVVCALRLNGDTASNYSNTSLAANGSSAFSGRNANTTELFFADSTAISTTTPAMFTIDLFSYAGSTNKTLLATSSSDLNGSGITERDIGLWRSSAAINSIELRARSSTWKIGTTATLYGILKA